MAGLVPQIRSDAGKSEALPPGALDYALSLREEDGRRGVPQLIRLMVASNPEWKGKLRRSTLDRHLRARGSVRQRTVVPEGPFRTFEATQPLELVQGDILVGPVVLLGEKGTPVRCRIVCWIDDHSRYVLHLEAYADDKLASIEDALKQAILKYGLPRRIFVDNGLVYACTSFELACSELGIHKIHSTPRYPVSRGKQERFYAESRIMRSQRPVLHDWCSCPSRPLRIIL
jgi:transposase InsO family protein